MNGNSLDPGVDHMSAMKIIDEISDRGKMLLFESFCGGLVALSQILIFGIINSLGLPVMLCLLDRGAAKFIQEGTYKYILLQFTKNRILKSKIMAV
jgi:hypothetical protein